MSLTVPLDIIKNRWRIFLGFTKYMYHKLYMNKYLKLSVMNIVKIKIRASGNRVCVKSHNYFSHSEQL